MYNIPKEYDDKNYKIYKFLPINKINLRVTWKERLADLKERLANSASASTVQLEQMGNLEAIEEEQKKFREKIPFRVKYKTNFLWQIYGQKDDYFTLIPCANFDMSRLHYLMKKQKENSEELIYVPISGMDYTGQIISKTDIETVETYLSMFTRHTPNIYEVFDQEENCTMYIVGETYIYDNIEAKYRIELKNKEEGETFLNLIKALFILRDYKFETKINENSELEFWCKNQKISFDNLPEFIKNEHLEKEKLIKKEQENIISLQKELKEVQKSVNEYEKEYSYKERQIATYMVCRKTFMGRLKYYFKKTYKQEVVIVQSKEENEKKTEQKKDFFKKDFYTVEDLVNISIELNKVTKQLKGITSDIAAQNQKKNNLDKKIENAKKFLDEIEKYKKNIFEFWKFSKQETELMLNSGEQEIKRKITKIFNYEKDKEEFSKDKDRLNRKLLTKEEQDALYLLNQIENNNYENDKKEFDIFGNVSEENNKTKKLGNNIHREPQKEAKKINYTTEEAEKIAKKALEKQEVQYNMSVYMVADKVEDNLNGLKVCNLNANNILNKYVQDIILYKFNVKENTKAIFYTNIMYFDNKNETLPKGMDVTEDVLLNIEKCELITEKVININNIEETDEPKISTRKMYIYEYNI